MPLNADRERQVVEFADGQGGAITWRQINELAMGWEGVDSRMERGLMRRATHGVYELARGGADPWMRRAVVVRLAIPQAVFSHGSAAFLLELGLTTSPMIEVTVPHGCHITRRLEDLVVYRTRHLPAQQTVQRRGLLVTSPPRTFIDIAAHVPYDQLRNALDDALVRGLVRHHQIKALLRDPHTRCRPGSDALRRMLIPWDQVMSAGGGRPGSVAEIDVLRFVLDAGIPMPVPQYKVLDGERLLAKLDFAWPKEKVAVEVDGFRYHSSPRARAHDARRDHMMGARGWLIIRITPAGLAEAPQAFLDNLRSYLAARNR
jgi:hypothetical protein